MKAVFAFGVCVALTAPCVAAPAALRYIDYDARTGSSAAVVVGDTTLVYTDQFIAADAGADSGSAAAAQLAAIFQRLETTLRRAGTDLDHLVKLDVYVNSDQVASDIRRELALRFNKGHGPATSFVVTALPQPGALVALDAVAAADPIPGEPLVGAKFLDPGARLYVSGQADRSMNLVEATRKTLEGLVQTLDHCGRSMDDIVELKCFFQPMASAADVRNEVTRFFEAERRVPVSFVEWKAASPPIEIELVARGGPANNDTKEVLEFITPLGMTASPVYSRVAHINRGPTIFIGDIASPNSGTLDEQLQTSFNALSKLLVKTGSDFKHLVKATYYVVDDDISKAHNAIRPKFYDAARPPAASKALIAGTGHPGCRYVMDMIAVPTTSQ
jgi:enamine deaminase RidA (YjgF/YER057c/UK114 family)